MTLQFIPDGSTIFITSSDKEQTSQLIHDILCVKSHIPHVVIFSKDRPCTPELVQQEILERQWKLFSERHEFPDRDRRMIAIFDECFLNDPCMNPLFTMGRSLAITSLFALSHIPGIPPSRRHGIDILFIGQQPHEIERKRIYNQFIHTCSFEEFSKKLDESKFLVVRFDSIDPIFYSY